MTVRAYSRRRRDGVYERAVPGVSSEAEWVDRSIRNAYHHWRETITSRRGTLEEEFARLAARWREDTEYQSSITRIAMHPDYQRIIGMGPDVVPLILRDLEKTRSQWFWALQAITGDNPVVPGDRGYMDRMIRAWVRWGYRQRVL
jgi:hypothetical protein